MLLVALIGGVATLDDSSSLFGLLMFAALAAVLPVVTASLAATSTVRGWLAAA